MTWINRLRLTAGMLGVFLLVAALTLIFNQRQTQAASTTATIGAETYDVGASYGGTVTKQFVREGDSVTEGQRLFTVQSVSLQQDVANGLEISSTDAYQVNTKAGTLTYRATVAGQVSDLRAKLGNSLGNGEPFAKITVADSEFVDARYLLSPRDYERVHEGAKVSVLLPNNSSINGQVTTIKVTTDVGRARTDVRIDSEALRSSDLSDLTKPGTPVVATLQLRDDGPLAGVSDIAFNFLRQIGLE
jgi:HlyD family secretion protein